MAAPCFETTPKKESPLNEILKDTYLCIDIDSTATRLLDKNEFPPEVGEVDYPSISSSRKACTQFLYDMGFDLFPYLDPWNVEEYSGKVISTDYERFGMWLVMLEDITQQKGFATRENVEKLCLLRRHFYSFTDTKLFEDVFEGLFKLRARGLPPVAPLTGNENFDNGDDTLSIAEQKLFPLIRNGLCIADLDAGSRLGKQSALDLLSFASHFTKQRAVFVGDNIVDYQSWEKARIIQGFNIDFLHRYGKDNVFIGNNPGSEPALATTFIFFNDPLMRLGLVGNRLGEYFKDDLNDANLDLFVENLLRGVDNGGNTSDEISGLKIPEKPKDLLKILTCDITILDNFEMEVSDINPKEIIKYLLCYYMHERVADEYKWVFAYHMHLLEDNDRRLGVMREVVV
ncbi:MAG TPA: hypothetical protein PLV59_01340 [Candidatus Dojkabacteria bacterium]|nr:hypothetical protein [Candidatus Dojkabacteria bacterium]